MRLILLAIVTAVLLGAYREVDKRLAQRNSAPPVTTPVAVQVEQLELRPVTSELGFEGSVAALQSSWMSPLTSGHIVAILHEDGTRVARDAVLVRLDDRAALAELRAAEAQVAVDRAKRTRDVALQRDGLLSREALEASNAAVVQSESQVLAKRLNLELLQVKAPFSGMLGRHLLSVGTYVAPGDKLVQLTRLDQFAVDFQVPQRLLSSIVQKADASFETDTKPGKSFAGKVSFIDPNVSTDTRSFLARVLVDDPDGLLRPGVFGHVTLRTGQPEPRLTVPVAAVVPAITGSYVFKVVDGRARRVDVVAGARHDEPGFVIGTHEGDRIVVTQGLAPGDRVVTDGLFQLRDGYPVEVVPANDPQEPASAPGPVTEASR